MVQIGVREDEEKPLFASVPPGKSIHDVTFEEALKFCELPRVLGTDDADEEIIVNYGKFGPYVRIGKEYFSIGEEDPYTIGLEAALEIVKVGREQKSQNVIHDFGEVQVLNGRYGPYIKKEKKNYRIPKGTEPATLDLETCEQIIAEAPPPGRRRQSGKKRGAKK